MASPQRNDPLDPQAVTEEQRHLADRAAATARMEAEQAAAAKTAQEDAEKIAAAKKKADDEAAAVRKRQQEAAAAEAKRPLSESEIAELDQLEAVANKGTMVVNRDQMLRLGALRVRKNNKAEKK